MQGTGLDSHETTALPWFLIRRNIAGCVILCGSSQTPWTPIAGKSIEWPVSVLRANFSNLLTQYKLHLSAHLPLICIPLFFVRISDHSIALSARTRKFCRFTQTCSCTQALSSSSVIFLPSDAYHDAKYGFAEFVLRSEISSYSLIVMKQNELLFLDFYEAERGLIPWLIWSGMNFSLRWLWSMINLFSTIIML